MDVLLNYGESVLVEERTAATADFSKSGIITQESEYLV